MTHALNTWILCDRCDRACRPSPTDSDRCMVCAPGAQIEGELRRTERKRTNAAIRRAADVLPAPEGALWLRVDSEYAIVHLYANGQQVSFCGKSRSLRPVKLGFDFPARAVSPPCAQCTAAYERRCERAS